MLEYIEKILQSLFIDKVNKIYIRLLIKKNIEHQLELH